MTVASAEGEPTADEIQRWSAPEVVDFRRRIAPFLFVTGTFFVVDLIGGPNLMFVSAFWGISIAYKYAKLWSDGYDWRDVFQQPRDKMIVDVAAETIDDAKAIFNPQKRAEVRERDRKRRLSQGISPVGGFPAGAPASAAGLAALGNGPYASAARQAMLDRDEIVRMMLDVPKADQARLPEVVPSARSLADKVIALATGLTALDREVGTTGVEAIEKEIGVLEAQANPLDRAASESRVRRLATLKRMRRAAADAGKKRVEMAARLESCAIALQNMKLDILRLKTGNQTWQHVTSVAEQAMALAREVDAQVYAGDAMAGLGRSQPRG